MLKLVTTTNEITHQTLDELARQGAKSMIAQALVLETNEYIDRFKDLKDDEGRRLVVRNGVGAPRSVTVGSGTMQVKAPRVDDRREGEKFTSFILPPYMRKSPKVESLLPILYLKGLSTSDFRSALEDLLGIDSTAGLSASSITQLKKCWEKEFDEWRTRPITGEYAYIWVDGVHVSIRLGEDKRLCLLVVIGVDKSGEKHLLAVEPGYRESSDSWAAVLRNLHARGFKAPLLAVGDGALGFWNALRSVDGFQETLEQRCWVHKIRNVLDVLPKRLHAQAKGLLQAMMNADCRADAERAKREFAAVFNAKHPKSFERIEKSWTELTAFFDFPARHWIHLRTTNPIESSFATVRLRTNITKGAGSAIAATTMAFKLLQDAEKTWKRIRGHEDVPLLLSGVAFKDGVMLAPEKRHGIPA